MKSLPICLAFLLSVTSCIHFSLPEEKKIVRSDSSTALITDDSLSSLTENFDIFYQKFHADREFQLSRIKFPLEGSYNDYDTVMTWSQENWGFMITPVQDIDSVKYRLKFDKKDTEVFEGIYCRECGFSCEARFDLISGRWYLTYRMDNNF